MFGYSISKAVDYKYYHHKNINISDYFCKRNYTKKNYHPATGEGMCSGKCCELCKTVESQICTSETNNAIYVKKEKKKKKNVAGGEE